MPFLTTVDIHFVEGTDLVRLEEDLVYKARSGEIYRIPKGFQSDGASIPRVLWPRFGHPFASGHRSAALLHDYLCRNGKRLLLTRAEADALFREALLDSHIKPAYVCWMFWLGVRIGAFFGVGVPK